MGIARLKIRRLRRLLARHRLLLYVEVVFFWLVFVTAIFYGISSFIVPWIAEAKVEKLCGGSVDIQSGRFAGIGAVHLKGVVIAADTASVSQPPILQADRVRIQFDPWRLLRGRWSVRSVGLSDFLLTVDYDPNARHWNLQDLSFESPPKTRQTAIPLITINQGAVRLRQTGPDSENVITTVSLTGRIAEKTGANEYGFSLRTDGRFGYGPSHLQGGLQIGKEGTQNHFWITGNVCFPHSGVLGNRWDLRDLSLNASYDEKTIALSELSFSLGTGQANLYGLMHRTEGMQMDLNVLLKDFQISDQSVPNAVVYGQMYDFLGPSTSRFLKRYQPVGTGSIGTDEQVFNIKTSVRDLWAARLNGPIRCTNIAVTDRRFPYALQKLKGDIEFKDRTLYLKDLYARHDDVHLTLSGTIENFGPAQTIDFRVKSPDMQFDEDLFRALSDSIKELWYEFSPQGRMGVDYRFQKSSVGDKRLDLILDLKNISALYKYFPYPLENLTGTIIFGPDSLTLKNLVAAYPDSRRVRVNGQIFQAQQAEPNFRIDVLAEAIPIDDVLINAFPPKQQTLFKSLQIEAVADVNVMVVPNQTDARYLDYAARINLQADRLLHEDFPLPMQEVTASAIVTPDVILLDRFDAQTPGGTIHFKESKLFPQGLDPNRPGYCLDLDLNNFELNQDFWQTAGADANQLLGNFQVFGPVDANGLLEINLAPQSCRGTDLMITCSNDRLTWSGRELGRMLGGLHIQDQKVSFEAFAFDDLVLEGLPTELMNERTRSFYAWGRPQGRADIQVENGFLLFDHGRLSRIDVSAALELQGISCGKSNALRQLDGICSGRLAVDLDKQRWQTEAHYQIQTLQYRNWLATDLSGDLAYDPDSMQLKTENLNASFYNGRISGQCRVNLKPESKTGYELNLEYGGVEVGPLLAAARQQVPEQAGQGQAFGRLGLGGTFEDLSMFQGNLEVAIKDLQIGQQSLLGKVLTAVRLQRPENFVFSQIDLRADIKGPELNFNRVRMVGRPLVFDGTGRLDLSSRQMEIQLSARDRMIAEYETILDGLTRGVSSALWRVDITGTLDEPKVDAVYLSILKQPLDIFKKDE